MNKIIKLCDFLMSLNLLNESGHILKIAGIKDDIKTLILNSFPNENVGKVVSISSNFFSQNRNVEDLFDKVRFDIDNGNITSVDQLINLKYDSDASVLVGVIEEWCEEILAPNSNYDAASCAESLALINKSIFPSMSEFEKYLSERYTPESCEEFVAGHPRVFRSFSNKFLDKIGLFNVVEHSNAICKSLLEKYYSYDNFIDSLISVIDNDNLISDSDDYIDRWTQSSDVVKIVTDSLARSGFSFEISESSSNFINKLKDKIDEKERNWLVSFLNENENLKDLEDIEKYIDKRKGGDRRLHEFSDIESLRENYKKRYYYDEIKEEALINTDYIYEDEDVKVVLPRSSKASEFWGQRTKWCTSGNGNLEDIGKFEEYVMKKGLIMYHILTKPNSEIYEPRYLRDKICLSVSKEDGEASIKEGNYLTVDKGNNNISLEEIESYLGDSKDLIINAILKHASSVEICDLLLESDIANPHWLALRSCDLKKYPNVFDKVKKDMTPVEFFNIYAPNYPKEYFGEFAKEIISRASSEDYLSSRFALDHSRIEMTISHVKKTQDYESWERIALASHSEGDEEPSALSLYKLLKDQLKHIHADTDFYDFYKSYRTFVKVIKNSPSIFLKNDFYTVENLYKFTRRSIDGVSQSSLLLEIIPEKSESRISEMINCISSNPQDFTTFADKLGPDVFFLENFHKYDIDAEFIINVGKKLSVYDFFRFKIMLDDRIRPDEILFGILKNTNDLDAYKNWRRHLNSLSSAENIGKIKEFLNNFDKKYIDGVSL